MAKAKKKPSAAQLAARKKFAAMAKARAGKKTSTKRTKKSAPKKVVKAKPAKKRAPRKVATWFAVFVKVGNKKFYDTGTNKLNTDKAKAERYPDRATAIAAAKSLSRRVRVAHDGIFAEPATAPK